MKKKRKTSLRSFWFLLFSQKNTLCQKKMSSEEQKPIVLLSNCVVFVGRQWPIRISFVLRANGKKLATITRKPHTPKDWSDNCFVVPMMETDSLALRDEKEETVRGTICGPTPLMIAPFICKQRFFEYATSHGLVLHLPRHFASKEQIPDDIRTKCIAKARSGIAGQGHFFLDSEESLVTNPHLFTQCVIQEVIPGPLEYVTHVVAHKGRIVFCVTYEYNFGTDVFIKRGITEDTELRKIALPEKDQQTFEKFLIPCAYTGPCNFDFKRDCKGEVKIFEINARLGGSLMLKKTAPDFALFMTHLLEAFSL